jgi:hypothetical protein
MDPAFLSIFIFAIITILYYYFKPSLTVNILAGIPEPEIVKGLQEGGTHGDDLGSGEANINLNPPVAEQPQNPFQKYTLNSYIYLVCYILLTIMSQFFINFGILKNKCGGNDSSNFTASAFMTFIPWIFIFGSVVLILIVFPGFKSAFSNVIGYFAVSGKANEIMNELLVNTEIQNAINKEEEGSDKKAELQSSAEAIIKLCGNTSIMINQIVPDNFEDYWGILTPLMKPKYSNLASEDTIKIKSDLLNVVVMRDNIGEAMWYFYTAILLISVVQYNLSVRGCVMDPAAMAENHQKFVEEEDLALKNESTQIYSG